MTKATDAQIRETQEALAKDAANLPAGVRINFGDPEPIQKADQPRDEKAADKAGKQE